MLEKITVSDIIKMMEKAEYETALPFIKEKLIEDADNGHLNYLLALCHHNLRVDLDTALSYYNLSLKNGFQKSGVFYGRGLLYYQLCNTDAARADLKRALSLNPNHEQAKLLLEDLQLGLCEISYLISKRQFGDALPKLKQLVHKNQRSGSIHHLIAVCLCNMRNNYSEALDHYNLALECGYDEFRVLYHRGLLHRELTDIKAARADLERAVSIHPANQEAKQQLQDILKTESLSEGIILSSPVLVSCVPKSGTMLLKNILLSILGGGLIAPPGDSLASEEYIKKIPTLKNCIYYGHIWYSLELAQKISSIPKIVLIRDPRSVVVSLTHFLDSVANKHWTKGQLEQYWSKKSWEERLSAAIFGMSSVNEYPPAILDTFLNYALKWIGPNTLVVRYEDLLGSRFGGNDARVIRTVKSILDFLGVKKIDDHELAKKISVGADPSRSATFRSGKIESWRSEFTPSHVKQMKMVACELVSSLGYEPNENWSTKLNVQDSIARFGFPEINVKKINQLISQTRKFDWNTYIHVREDFLNEIAVTNSQHHVIDEWAFNMFIQAQQIENASNILELYLLKSAPDNPRWNYYLGIFLHSTRRDLQKALQHYNIALENGFDEFWVRYNRGMLFRELGDLNHAYIDLERAVSLDPKFQAAHRILKETREQIKSYASAIDLDNVQRLVDKSDFSEARVQLQELLGKFPTNPRLNYLYAYCLHQLKLNLNTARSYYDKALALGFDEFWVRYSRGCLYYSIGDHTAARIDLDKAASIQPLHEGPRMILKQL